MNFKQPKTFPRLSLQLVALSLLTTVIGSMGLASMQRANTGLNTGNQDRAAPLTQIMPVSDAYAVNAVGTAHKVREGAFTPQRGLDAVANTEICNNCTN